jgi:NAD(P)H-hydrate epimerase
LPAAKPEPLTAKAVHAVLKPLADDADKDSRGRVMVVGGSLRYPGALLIACRAAARCGAGVVTAATARSVSEAVAGEDPNITHLPLAESQPGIVAVGAAAQVAQALSERIRAMLLGPGLSHGTGTDDFVLAVLRNARATSTVIDADGLNALARAEDKPVPLPAKCVLTPHDGEAARMTGQVVPKGAQRVPFAERFATAWKTVVVLKGPVTVVTDGKRTFVHDAPNAALGVGGSGDALSGAVAAFLARGLTPLAAAISAVWVHGRAGALLANELGQSGALATEIADALPRALRQVIEGR